VDVPGRHPERGDVGGVRRGGAGKAEEFAAGVLAEVEQEAEVRRTGVGGHDVGQAVAVEVGLGDPRGGGADVAGQDVAGVQAGALAVQKVDGIGGQVGTDHVEGAVAVEVGGGQGGGVGRGDADVRRQEFAVAKVQQHGRRIALLVGRGQVEPA